MTPFTFYLRDKLEQSGYAQVIKHDTENDLIIESPARERIWVCYLDKPLEPERIRRCFDFKGHVLFVVKESLIPDEIESREATPMWLRVLHGLYMGRIYVWNDRHLFGLHFDYDTGDVSESGIIQPDELLLVENQTWLRGWSGMYKLARFWDRRWWDEPVDDTRYANYGTYQRAKQEEQSNARAEYEQARDSYWEQQRAREQQWTKENDRWRNQTHWDVPPRQEPPPKAAPLDFMTQFARAGSPSAVKALYRTLAKQYHPDFNPDKDTTEIMQQVNAAYERFK